MLMLNSIITMDETRKQIESKGRDNRRRLVEFLKTSGFHGNLGDFGKRFLSLNKDQLYYLYKSNGDLKDFHKQIIFDQMKDGKNRQHGIRDVALSLLDQIVGKPIPRGGDIIAAGDNIAISSKNIKMRKAGNDNSDLLQIAKEEIERLKLALVKAETERDIFKQMLNEERGNK